MSAVVTVSGWGGLTRFRTKWSAPAVLELVPQHGGRLLINWEVGVGKSYNIDEIIDVVLAGESDYDLLIALFPTNAIIDERRGVKTPLPDSKIIRLKSRQEADCGSLNKEWSRYERRGLSLLAKSDLCTRCSHHPCCSWLGQYGEDRLKDAKVIIGTHAHLRVNNDFVDFMASKVGARRVLVIIDEDSFAKVSFKRRVTSEDLNNLLDILMILDIEDGNREQWVDYIGALASANTHLLCNCGWDAPEIVPRLLLEIQKHGVDRHGDDYRCNIYNLGAFGGSPLESREKMQSGDLTFALVPRVNSDIVVYSATANPRLLAYRMGIQFGNHFEDYRFMHPGTVWYNLASNIGSAGYFPRNADQILFFFAKLIERRASQGKRILLISKKRHLKRCANWLNEYFTGEGLALNVVYEDEADSSSRIDESTIYDHNVIPLIHYGVVGINLYENFDCAFCLNTYNMRDDVLNNYLQGTLATDLQTPVEIKYKKGLPRRRTAGASRMSDRIYDANELAPLALYELEMGFPRQVVGRIRPYTSPAEVITFQCNDHPQGSYSKEFNNLKDAREYFDIASKREEGALVTKSSVKACRSEGLTQRETKEKTGLSIRTIRNHWT